MAEIVLFSSTVSTTHTKRPDPGFGVWSRETSDWNKRLAVKKSFSLGTGRFEIGFLWRRRDRAKRVIGR